MPTTRRELLKLATAAAASGALSQSAIAQGSSRNQIKVVAFDGFGVFDPRSIAALAEELFPGKGMELNNLWRTRQFEYTWLRVVTERYADFWRVTDDALVFAAKMLKLDLTPEKRSRLMEAFLHMKPWPHAQEGLQALRDAGLRLAFLSNFTVPMLQANAKNAGLDGLFDKLLSTDAMKTYKPSPHAYQMAMDAFRVARENVLFVAFGGWDASGAKSFGYKTFWLNPANLPVEELAEVPDAIAPTFPELVKFAQA